MEIDLSLLCGYFKGEPQDDDPHQVGIDGELDLPRITGETGVSLRFGVLDDALGFGGHEVANADALFPSAGVVPFGLERIGGFVEEAVVGGDHAPLRAVHEHSHAAEVGFELVAERADEIGADQADSAAEDFGMDGVVDEGADGLAGGRDGLDHAHAGVVEFRSVVVVGDFSLGFAGGDLEVSGLQVVEGLIDGDGGLIADEVHVLEIARGFAVEAGEAVAVRGAVRVGRADENVVGGDAGNLLMNAGAQDGGEPEEIELDDGDFGFALLEDHGAGV